MSDIKFWLTEDARDLELISAAALKRAEYLDSIVANPHTYVSASSSSQGIAKFVANMRAEAAEIRAAVERTRSRP